MTDEEIENSITHNGELNLENIPVQKCILSHEHGHVVFEDELGHDSSLFDDGCSCYIQRLVDACLKSFEAEYFNNEIFTCSCGDAECAGIYDVYSLIKDGQIFISVNDEIVFHFDREQFKNEVLRLLENMLEELKTEYALYPFFGMITDDDKVIEMIKKLKPDYDFSDYQKSKKHKILIKGGGENVYRDIDKEWHEFEEDGSLTFTEDGGNTIKIKIEGLQEWSNEIEIYEDSHKISGLKGFPWEDWNKRGIEYTKKIAEQLPENYAVYYGYNSYDGNHNNEKPFRIGRFKFKN